MMLEEGSCVIIGAKRGTVTMLGIISQSLVEVENPRARNVHPDLLQPTHIIAFKIKKRRKPIQNLLAEMETKSPEFIYIDKDWELDTRYSERY